MSDLEIFNALNASEELIYIIRICRRNIKTLATIIKCTELEYNFMLSNGRILIHDTVVYTHSNISRYSYSNSNYICTPDALTVKILLYTDTVNGGWSSWRLGPCSKTCGRGIQNYTRVCDNPKPSCGGKECKGPSSHFIKCNEFCCPGKIAISFVLITFHGCCCYLTFV